MLGILRNKKAQNTAEYAILIGLVVAAVMAMQTYVKRGLQGKMQEAADDFTTELGATQTQYEPTYISSQATQDTIKDWQKETMEKGGTVEREIEQKTRQAAGDYQKYDY